MDTSAALRALALEDSPPKKGVVHRAVDLMAGQRHVFLLLYIFATVFATSYASASGCLYMVGPLSFVGSFIYLSSGLHAFYALKYGSKVWFLIAVLVTIGLAEFTCSFRFSGSVLLSSVFGVLNIGKAFAVRKFLSQSTCEVCSFAFLGLVTALILGSAIVANVVAAKFGFQPFTSWHIAMGVVTWALGDSVGMIVGLRGLHLAKTYPPFVDTTTPDHRAEVVLHASVILNNAMTEAGQPLTELQAKRQSRYVVDIIGDVMNEWERWGTSPDKLGDCIKVALQRAKFKLRTKQIMNNLYCSFFG